MGAPDVGDSFNVCTFWFVMCWKHVGVDGVGVLVVVLVGGLGGGGGGGSFNMGTLVEDMFEIRAIW